MKRVKKIFKMQLNGSGSTSDGSHLLPGEPWSVSKCSLTHYSSNTIFLANIRSAGVRWEKQNGGLDRSKCWHLSGVSAAATVWSGLVMWPPQLCSISLCRPSPNHGGNCQGQISHICWVMVTTIARTQLSLSAAPMCVCVCVLLWWSP